MFYFLYLVAFCAMVGFPIYKAGRILELTMEGSCAPSTGPGTW
jgi:hypothetical protein